MVALVDDDPEIGSLNAHLPGEPAQAIVVTPGQENIDVKNNILAIMPHYYGRKIESPYDFLYDFCKICGIQKRPNGSNEDDYRLRVIPFTLKGEADTWFMRLLPNSIRTWADFRSQFLDYFFPSTRTNALKKKIQGAHQDCDETLNQYWSRFKGTLDAYPNNHMVEAKIFNNFYEGMTPESKDLMNSLSGGDFSKLKVSEAKRVLDRLVNAKKAYDSPRALIVRRVATNTTVGMTEDMMDVRMDRLEKAILTAMEKNNPSAHAEKVKTVSSQEKVYSSYRPPREQDFQAHVNAVGNWNQNSNWNPWKIKDAPWRDHPNFRWSDPNTAQKPPSAITYQQPPAVSYQQPPAINYPQQSEGQPQWQNCNHDGQNNWNKNRGQGNQPN
ncbi:uncharacterized protein LOC121804089 [Salvia splendens]|uniref:uncharacterized protein LOC121804089 n=1 Tax=Salvia splendens TaxID=180675 RepID=UPI001C258586|nr:uncharacterized protein LOC121804089 [Salvia splendens]